MDHRRQRNVRGVEHERKEPAKHPPGSVAPDRRGFPRALWHGLVTPTTTALTLNPAIGIAYAYFATRRSPTGARLQLDKEIRPGIPDKQSGGALTAHRVSAYDGGGHALELTERKVRGGRQLIGNRDDCACQLKTVGVNAARQIAERSEPAHPDRGADDHVPQGPRHRGGDDAGEAHAGEA